MLTWIFLACTGGCPWWPFTVMTAVRRRLPQANPSLGLWSCARSCFGFPLPRCSAEQHHGHWCLTFPLKSISCSWEAVRAAGYFHNQTKYVFRKEFRFPIYVLLLDSAFQKPLLPKKNKESSISFKTGERWRMNICEWQVSFQAILSKTEAFLKWFAAVIACLASCSCFWQFISWVYLPPGTLCVVIGCGGSWKASKRQGAFKTIFISFPV